MNRDIEEIFFEQDEYQMYARQLSLKNIQLQGQKRLKKAKVLCVGSGGLGSIVLLYLATSGLGIIGIIDDDTLDLSNLHRQVLYEYSDLYKYKALSAKKHLYNKNQNTHVNTYIEKITDKNAFSIIKNYDLVVDCTDNFQTRNILSHTCKQLNKVHVYAAISSFIGQASVFNYMGGPSYHEIYCKSLASNYKSCTTNGVLGILPGMMGMIQATEAIKIITGIGNVISGYIVKYNALNMSMTKVKIRQNIYKYAEQNQPNKYINNLYSTKIRSITIEEINNLNINAIKIYLIDVRDPHEYNVKHIKQAVNIPLSVISKTPILKLIKIKSHTSKIIITCNSYAKSRAASNIFSNEEITHFIFNKK